MTHGETMPISRHAVHVWQADLDQFNEPHGALSRTLSPDEQARAARLRFEADRRRFVTARGILRQILGGYLGIAPQAIHFRYGPAGKPELAPATNPGRLRFNLAHADGIALYAVTADRAVGIDLERIRVMPDAAQIAARFYSERERSTLFALPPDQQPLAFFHGWTRKEAYLKATGAGLIDDLHRIEVSLTPGEPAQILHTGGAQNEAARWRVVSLRPAPEYVGALVVEGDNWQLVERSWPGLA